MDGEGDEEAKGDKGRSVHQVHNAHGVDQTVNLSRVVLVFEIVDEDLLVKAHERHQRLDQIQPAQYAESTGQPTGQ